MTAKAIQSHLKDEKSLRESETRRQHLEDIALMKTGGTEVHVQIGGDEPFVNLAASDSKFGHTDRLVINVRSGIPEQALTQYDDDAWDLMVQKMDLYRELGHILYTDWPEFEKRLEGDGQGNYGVTDEHQGLFINWFDHLEDAIIESFLTQRFDIDDELRVTNANLLEENRPDKMVSLNAAVILRIVEEKYPVGWIYQLLDRTDDDFQFLHSDDEQTFIHDILPTLETQIPKILSEPNPSERYDLIYELYEYIGIFFDASVMPGTDEQLPFDMGEDAIEMGSKTSGMDPTQSGQLDPPEPEPEPDPQSNQQNKKQDRQKLPDPDIQQDYANQANQQKDQLDLDEAHASFEKWGRVIDEEYDQGADLTLDILPDFPADGNYNANIRNQAEQESKVLSKELQERLKKARRTSKQTKRKSGKPDPSRVHKTALGDLSVFSQTGNPDEKEYACLIVLDRSGSMGSGSSGIMEDAEKSAGSLAFALEDVGVDVGLISVSGGDVMLEMDFHETVDECKERLFRGYNANGTPLSDALALARGRLEQQADSPFVITITDGRPDHRERYRDMLAKCNFPVLGVYIDKYNEFDEDHMNEHSYFHKLEMRGPKDVFQGVRNLVKGVMF